jgi:hypothetical protein
LRIQNFLFSFEFVVTGLGANNLTRVLMQAPMHEKGLTNYLISKRFMTFGVDQVFIFQGTKLGVTKQIVDG